jgi:hypothetical protein
VPKSAPLASDVDFDALGQFELGASGIAAAVLRGAALASQRCHNIESAAKKHKAEGPRVVQEVSIMQKDFEDAARAQVRILNCSPSCASGSCSLSLNRFM